MPPIVKRSPKIAGAHSRAAMMALRAELGDDSVQFLGSDEMSMKIRGVISTQCPSLDAAIGRGGIPQGRLTIVYGKEGGGKSTLALHIVAETQRCGGIALYIDKEHKLDPDYASSIGVKTEELLFGQAPYLETVLKEIKVMIKHARKMRVAGHKFPILVVLDSINAAKARPPKKKEIGDKHYPDEARIWSEELPSIIEDASKAGVALLFVSQVRKKLGIMFGDPDDLAGGNAPKFYASLIIRIQRTGSTKNEKSERITNITEGWCQKNQIAPPFKKASFQIRFGKGIDYELSLVEQAIADGILEVVGKGRVMYKENVVAVGKVAASIALRKNKEWRDDIANELMVKRGWK